MFEKLRPSRWCNPNFTSEQQSRQTILELTRQAVCSKPLGLDKFTLAQGLEPADTIFYYYSHLEQAPNLKDSRVVQKADQDYRQELCEQVEKKMDWLTEIKEVARPRGGSLNIVQTTEVSVFIDGLKTNQQYQLIDIEEPTSQEDLQIIINTLDQIDQFSGGMLTAHGHPQRIIIDNDLSLNKRFVEPDEDDLTVGKYLIDSGTVHIDMATIEMSAPREEIGRHEYLASVLIHELLGHAAEKATYGSTGVKFPKHFMYSKERVESAYGPVHREVKSYDGVDSRPVSTYSYTNPAEDLATSVEAHVGVQLGIVGERDFYLDQKRRDVIAHYFTETALKSMLINNENPGFVGVPIFVAQNHVNRRRQIKITNRQNGYDYLKSEIQRIVDEIPEVKQVKIALVDLS